MLAARPGDVDERWRYYEQLAGLERTQPEVATDEPTDGRQADETEEE
jgi:hypothetical protein